MRMSPIFLIFLSVTSCLVSATHTQEDILWIQFKSKHGKEYNTAEEERIRKLIFRKNLEKISSHNKEEEEGRQTWRMDVTQFTDMTEQEFQETVLGGYVRTPRSKGFTEVLTSLDSLPESVDWRQAGVVTQPKNQGSCGSCWAFATVENIESYSALANVTSVELSTQEVTTCTPNTLHCGGKGGCRGSIPQLGYNYIQLFGLATEHDYPYWSGVTGMTGTCKYDVEKRTPVVSITGYNTLPPNDLAATLSHIANNGPLAVAGDASLWQFYGSGVFNGCKYDHNIGINHAIQMVGYGTDSKHGDYWLVRNSWGKHWGEHGYIRLHRESELTCGTNTTPMDGTACQGGPGTEVQEVCGMCGILFDSSYPLGVHGFSGL